MALAAALLLAHFDPWFGTFRQVEELDAHLDELATAQPRASVLELGASHESRAIRALELGTGAPGRPTVVAIGTQHPREWISPMVTMCIADALAHGLTDEDPDIVDLIDRIDVVVVPVVNPDGYVYSWQVDRMWRTNRRPGGGVDLNRNWAAMWGTGVAGEPPGSATYPGPSAFSEPETTAVAALVEARQTVGFLDFHAPIATILYPFAYTSDPGPMEATESAWAESMAAAMTAAHGVPHGTGKPGVGNPSGGLAQDWAHGEVGALAWTVELRGGGGTNPFVLPETEIIPACEEAFAGFLHIAGLLADEYGDEPAGGGETGADTGGADSAGESESPTSSSTSGAATDDDDDESEDPPTDGSAVTGAGAPAPRAGSDSTGCGCRSSNRPTVPLGAAVFVLGVFTLRRRRAT